MVFVSCLEMGAGLTSFTLTSAIVWFNESLFAIVWWFICNSVTFDGIPSPNQVGAAPGRTLNLDLVSFYFPGLFPFLVVFLLLNFQFFNHVQKKLFPRCTGQMKDGLILEPHQSIPLLLQKDLWCNVSIVFFGLVIFKKEPIAGEKIFGTLLLLNCYDAWCFPYTQLTWFEKVKLHDK